MLLSTRIYLFSFLCLTWYLFIFTKCDVGYRLVLSSKYMHDTHDLNEWCKSLIFYQKGKLLPCFLQRINSIHSKPCWFRIGIIYAKLPLIWYIFMFDISLERIPIYVCSHLWEWYRVLINELLAEYVMRCILRKYR